MVMLRPFLPARRRAGIPLGANAAVSGQFPSFGEFCCALRLDVAITGISIRACAHAVPGEGKSRSAVARDQFFCQL
jgi:hypothetical protein